VRRRTQDELIERYDHVIGLRAAGLSYREIAGEIGVKTASEAQQAYFAARGSQIPTVTERTRPRPSGLTVAWAAGFFDGEGCIYGYEGVQNGGYRRFTFGVTVAQVVPEPLEELRAGWGGKIRAKAAGQAHHSDQWIWSIRGSDAGWFLEDVLPHLRVKYAGARAAIPCLLNVHRHGVGFTEAEVLSLRTAISVIHRGNRKGKRAGR